MKKRQYLPALIAVILVLTAGIGTTFAYFTTYARATGGHKVVLGEETEIQEEVYERTKHVQIRAIEGSVPVFVRVKAFAPSQYDLDFEGGSWTEGPNDASKAEGTSNWWYYNTALEAPAEDGDEERSFSLTDELQIHIGNIPGDPENGDTFDVIVVYEVISADGEMVPMNEEAWSTPLSTETWPE